LTAKYEQVSQGVLHLIVADFQSDIDDHLSANTSKKKVMVISMRKKPLPDHKLILNAQPIERVSFAKFLGLEITDNLS
jgi:hypothetical protein